MSLVRRLKELGTVLCTFWLPAHATEDRRVTYMDAFRYVLKRAGRFGRLAGRALVRLAIVALPGSTSCHDRPARYSGPQK